jgi:hypothetical protein
VLTDAASSKATAAHLSRTAPLYVRQSTLKQVISNTESAIRQYDLRGRPPRADRPPRRHHHHHRRHRDRPARRLRRPDRDGDRRHRHPRRGRQARHPRHLDPDPTRPGHRPARTRPRRRARRPARHPRRQRSGRTPAGDASRWLVRGRGSGLVSWPRPVGAPGFGGVEHRNGRRASAGHCLRLDSVTGKVHPTRPIQAP